MRLELTVTPAPDAEPIVVVTNLLCLAEWERELNRKISDGRGIGVSDLAYWAHFLLKLAGRTTAADWKAWITANPDARIEVRDLTDPNPTVGATSAGS